jgi:hypothetical protein
MRNGPDKFYLGNLLACGELIHMTHNNVIRTALSEIEHLVADQVGRVSALKAVHLNTEKAETKLSLLYAKLAIKRAEFSRFTSAIIKTYHPPKKLLRETAEVGGPRWRIGWGGID